MKKHAIVRDEWRILSDKFVKHHRLPYGTKLLLEHSPVSQGSRARRARNDTTFKRHLFRGRVAGHESVKDLFDKYLLPALIVNPIEKGLRVKLQGPSGEEVKKTNMLISTVRNWAPLPTPTEIEAEELLNAEIDEIAEVADMTLRSSEELRNDSDRVLRGYLRAMCARYGREGVDEAIALEKTM